MNCIVIDDEPLAASLLSDYILKTEGLHLAGMFTNAIEGLRAIQEQEPDLVFLDIQMPDLTGLQILKITGNKCRFILTTAYQEYALEGFEHEVVDYLLKPIGFERFLIAVNRARERGKTTAPAPNAVKAPDYIFVKTEYKIKKINLADILYFEALRDYVCIHTMQEKVMTLQSMRSFESQLATPAFVRVHKSFLVALGKIDHIEKNRVVIQEQYIPVGEVYRPQLMQAIGTQF
jgi:two-component system, LytTR family, response regulator